MAAVVGHCVNIESELGVPTVPLITSEFYEQVKTHHTIQKGMPGLRVTYLIPPVWGKTAEQIRKDIVGNSPPTGKMIMQEIVENLTKPLTAEEKKTGIIEQSQHRVEGANFDVRKHEPYSVYPEFDFDIPVYQAGDSMSRYMVRMDEMEQSMRIIEQALDKLPDGPVMAAKPPKIIKPEKGDYYHAVEAARGSFGVRLVSDGTNSAYRLKLRSPTFSNLSLFGEAAKGMLLPDALALMGSLDLVIPEIDR